MQQVEEVCFSLGYGSGQDCESIPDIAKHSF